MLKIENLCANVKDKRILNDFNININNGEIHAIMGPNGTGKSTLSRVIAGDNDYDVVSGNIYFNNININKLSVDERAKLGIFLSMQNPPTIEGITNSEFLKTAVNSNRDNPIGLYDFVKMLENSMQELGMQLEDSHKSINRGASGGERKKNEILQMKVLKPKFIILDELDSGLDVDNLKVVCSNVVSYLHENPEVSVLIITHYSRILEYIKPDYVHMMKDGQIVKTGDYKLAYEIEKLGYGKINNISENETNE